MSQFPSTQIQYSEATPSGRIPSNRANLDMNTGMGEVGAAVSKLGGAMTDIAEKIQVANDAVELSTLERKRDEFGIAAETAMQTAWTPEEQKAITDKYNSDVMTLTSKSKRVNDAFSISNNKHMPFTNARLRGLGRTKQIEKLEQDDKINDDHDLLFGLKDNYSKRKLTNASLGVITPETAKYSVDNFDNLSALRKTENDIRTGNLISAEARITQFDTTAKKGGLPEGQLRAFDSLKSLYLEESGRMTLAYKNSLNDKMIKADSNDNMTAVELRDTAEGFRADIVASQLTGSQKRELLNSVKTWEKDEGSVNFPVINNLNERIDSYIYSGQPDSTLKEDINNAKLDGSFGSRKGMVTKSYASMMKRLDAAEYKTNYKATLETRGVLSNDLKKNSNKAELLYLYDKDIGEGLSQKEMNDTEAELFAARTAENIKKISKKEAGELMEIRKTGAELIAWTEKPTEEKIADLNMLAKTDVSFWTTGKSEVKDRWTKQDIKKAKSIVGDYPQGATYNHVVEFEKYLEENNKAHFEKGKGSPVNIENKLPLVKTGDNAAYNALPSGKKTLFIDENGKKWIKP